MTTLRALVAFVLVAVLVQESAAFHFFVQPGHYTCYIEELTTERTLVQMSFQVCKLFTLFVSHVQNENNFLNIIKKQAGTAVKDDPINIEVITPRGVTIFSDKIRTEKGVFQVTTQGVSGPHSFCFLSKAARSTRLDIDIEYHQTGTQKWEEHTDPATGRKYFHNRATKQSVWELNAEQLQLKIRDVKATDGEVATTKQEIEAYVNYMKALHAMMVQISEESSNIVDRQHKFKETSDETANILFFLSISQVCTPLLLF